MNIDVIVQARMTSTRLPGKVLKEVCGKPVLELLVERIKKSKKIRKIIIATSINITDNPIIELADKLNIYTFRGSEQDVLRRVLDAADFYNTDVIVEITGDCPLIDHRIIDKLVGIYIENDYDYVSNILKRTYPRGLDTQVFSKTVLKQVDSLTDHPIDREHVSIYIYNHPEIFKLHGIEAEKPYKHPEYRWTLDTTEDFEFIRTVYEELYYQNPEFTTLDVIKLLNKKPELLTINSHIPQKTTVYYE